MTNHFRSPTPPRVRAVAIVTAAVIGLTSAWMLACDDDDDSGAEGPTGPDSVGAASEFREPPTLRSTDGVLRVDLSAAPARVRIGTRQVRATVYGGLYTPWTLRLRPGDVLRVSLANNSGLSTNLHTHGFGVSPMGNSDNVFRTVTSRSRADYEIRIPENHPPGLFWYHPHFHMTSSDQVKQGMSGGIIVEGLLDPFPELRGVQERLLLLKDAQITGGTIDTTLEIGVNTTRTVNGLVNPTMVIRPGETQLWRIGNIGANLYYRLRLDGHRFHVVAVDGNRQSRITDQDELLIPPASRVEALVQGEAAGTYQLRTLAIDTGPEGDQYGEAVLATLQVTGDTVSRITLPTSLLPVQDLRPAVTNRRTVVFSETPDGDTFFIDGKTFDPNRVDTQVRLGAVEEWTIQNVSSEWHAFHIHQGDFQIVSVNGVDQPFDGYHDIAQLPSNSEVKIIIPFTDPVAVGKYVYHCHLLDHEDGGMMASLELLPADAPPVATSAAAGAGLGHSMSAMSHGPGGRHGRRD